MVITDSSGAGTFAKTDTKLYVPVVTLSTQENTKLHQQLKSGFKRVINWNKYLSKPESFRRNANLNYLVETSLHGINRLFTLAFEGDKKNGAYVINLDEYRNIGTHWVALYVNNKTIIYFDSFGVEHIPKEIMKFIGS